MTHTLFITASIKLTGYVFPPCCILIVLNKVGIIISSDPSVGLSASKSQNLSTGIPDVVSSSYTKRLNKRKHCYKYVIILLQLSIECFFA